MSKEVIVTGGAGYIGSHTVVELLENGYSPIILDDFRNSKPWILERIAKITGITPISYVVDCQNEDQVHAVFKKHAGAAGVIHFAADKAVGESVEQPVKYYQNNVGSLCVILGAMEKHNINQLVFSSSCTVYGEADTAVVTEETPIQAASSPYGDTKITCEKIIRYAQAANPKLKTILLRYFNPIGAHPSALIGELPQGVPNNLVPYITQTAQGIREKLTVFGNNYDTVDGTNVRDYIHVVDLSQAHLKALAYAQDNKDLNCEAINIGTGKGSSVLEIINTFEKVNNLKLNFVIGDRRAGDVAQIYANAEKAKTTLNWTCKYSIEDALQHSWNWELQLVKG